MVRRQGDNVQRRVLDGAQNIIGDDVRKLNTRGQTPTMQRAVVQEVIQDPVSLPQNEKDRISQAVNNSELVEVMPVNSIIAKLVSDAQGTSKQPSTILFPFFSSHFLLPVKPGEVVQVIYDDFAGGGTQIGYWVTRTHSNRSVEDSNYTHLDRRFDPSTNPINYRTSDRSNLSSEQPGPGFQNGGNTPDTFTITPSGSMDKPYDRIFNQAKATSVFTMEPVPRWNKRPQEFVIQGSNNALIVLGEDRKGSVTGSIAGSEQERDAKGQSGTIDMMVGRGRILPKGDNENPQNNAPRVITNQKGIKETDKAPFRRNKQDNANEGNPDFQNDAAHLYITMQSEADINFGIADFEFTENTQNPTQPNEGTEGTLNKSYIVSKADHLRMISRKDEENSIEGTILMVREGSPEEDLSYIFFNKEGVQIEAPRINLSKALSDNPDGDFDGKGEPYIKWSQYKAMVERLQGEIDEIRDALQKQIDEINSQFGSLIQNLSTQFGSAAAATGGPVTQLQTLPPVINQFSTQLNSTVTQEKQSATNAQSQGENDTLENVNNARSEIIFGW